MYLHFNSGKLRFYSIQQLKGTIVLILSFFIFLRATGQNFDTHVTRITTKFGALEAPAYSTKFDFGKDKVMKGFWKFSKAYGYAVSYKTYYEVTIAPDKNESNVAVKIMGKAEDESGNCRFYLAVKKEEMPDDAYQELNKTMKQMLLTFKQNFYIDQLENQIVSNTKQAVRVSKQYERAKKKKGDAEKQGELMSSLATLNDLILKLQQEKTKLTMVEF